MMANVSSLPPNLSARPKNSCTVRKMFARLVLSEIGIASSAEQED